MSIMRNRRTIKSSTLVRIKSEFASSVTFGMSENDAKRYTMWREYRREMGDRPYIYEHATPNPRQTAWLSYEPSYYDEVVNRPVK